MFGLPTEYAAVDAWDANESLKGNTSRETRVKMRAACYWCRCWPSHFSAVSYEWRALSHFQPFAWAVDDGRPFCAGRRDALQSPLVQWYEKLISGPFKQKLTHSPRDELPNRIRRWWASLLTIMPLNSLLIIIMPLMRMLQCLDQASF